MERSPRSSQLEAPEITPPPSPPQHQHNLVRTIHATEESSIVAAGVPRKRAIWSRLAATAVVLVMLFMTASAITLYLERDAQNQKAAATTTGLIPPVPSQQHDDRNVVPAPPAIETKILPAVPAAEAPTAITPQPVMRPSMLPAAAAPPATPTPPRPTTTTASLPPQDPPVVPAIVVPTTPAARKIDNRSEVF